MLALIVKLLNVYYGEYMQIQLTDRDKKFQDEVRDFVRGKLPKDVAQKVLEHRFVEKEDVNRWHTALFKRGWAAPNWPSNLGGSQWTALQQHIFDDISSMLGAPRLSPFGISMIGPVLIEFGSDYQKNRFLPKILSGEEWWCQGYSEPGSGSDLASLRTQAELRGDSYIVNGQKTWTTQAQLADMMFCLVRTGRDGKKQNGISMLLINMHQPGVEVRPIVTIDGGSKEINEVWLQDVEVPVQNLVGDEGRGWTIAKFLLSHERTNTAGVGASKRELLRLKQIASKEGSGGRPLIEDPLFRDKISKIEIDLMALEWTVLRVAAVEAEGEAPGPEASILKLRGTEIQQELTQLQMEAVGPNALPYLPMSIEDNWIGPKVGPEYATALASRYFNYRKVSIYGGTNEIQRNIISKRVLGL